MSKLKCPTCNLIQHKFQCQKCIQQILAKHHQLISSCVGEVEQILKNIPTVQPNLQLQLKENFTNSVGILNRVEWLEELLRQRRSRIANLQERIHHLQSSISIKKDFLSSRVNRVKPPRIHLEPEHLQQPRICLIKDLVSIFRLRKVSKQNTLALYILNTTLPQLHQFPTLSSIHY